MIVTLRLAEEKIKESQIEKGGIPPRLCGLVGSLSGASLCEREVPGACDKMPRVKVSHPNI